LLAAENPTEETPMPVSRAQARAICTKPELELVEASFPPAVNALTPARLQSKIQRARKLQDKYRDLGRTQNRQVKGGAKGGARRATGRDANVRTERKARLFEETRQRFEKRLERMAPGLADAPAAPTE
jgi:hypothetical protein